MQGVGVAPKVQTEAIYRKFKYNTIFGTVEVDEKGEATYIGKHDGRDDVNLESYLRRELGVSKKVNRMNNAVDALTDPRQFLVNKTKAINQAADGCAAVYKLTYLEWVRRGEKEEKCQKRALEAAKKYFDDRMRIIEEDFPENSTTKVLNTLK